MPTLVLIRHGESEWNKQNLFTGWTDVALSEKGVEESVVAGNLLKSAGYDFDIAYTSFLKRAIDTLANILIQMNLSDIEIKKSWRLNERHYGALQGLNKSETAAKYGEEQVLLWRRSFDVLPPALTLVDDRYPGNDPKYGDIPKKYLPLHESLETTVIRFLPYWHDEIAPSIKKGKRVIIAAHGNSLRALVMHLENISQEEIVNLNIPTGIPLVYKLDDNLNVINKHYLGDPAIIANAIDNVSSQGKKV